MSDVKLLEYAKEIEENLSTSVKIGWEQILYIVVADLLNKYHHNKERPDGKEWADKFRDVLSYYLDESEMEELGIS